MPVSTLAISSGAAIAVSTVNGCIKETSRQPAHVGEPTGHCGGGDHGRAHDVGERAAALAALVVAVGGRSATLTRRHEFAVRAVAHRAPRVAPFEASIDED